MFVAALLTGVLTAYYFGVRPGVWAAAGTATLFLLALLWPEGTVLAYGGVAALVVGVCIMGPRVGRPGRVNVLGFGRKLLAWARQLKR